MTLQKLSLTQLIKELKRVLAELPDKRKGKNKQYEMVDAGMAAFSVFFTQCASFLARQKEMQRSKGRSNAESLFGMEKIPSDNQIRGMLDGCSPKLLSPIYRTIFERLESAGILDAFRSYANSLLIALDGTEYFSSQKIDCAECSHRKLSNGKTNYYHSALTPVIVQAGNENVISLEPEFITPQDGHEKQDCEITAGKRWVSAHGKYYARRNATILGDDLYSRQPFCQALKNAGLHFLLVCKPDSHVYLYDSVAFLAAQGTLGTYTTRLWNGKHGEIHAYRYANQLPLNGDKDAIMVNWVELTITHEESGATLYKNAFITDFETRENNVVVLVRDGRARWKIENENNNILKTKGYHLEHNFGHGNQHLSSMLLSMNLLAFLFHTVMALVDERYQRLRQALRKRQTFFQDVEALLRYFLFDSWDDLFAFMCQGLELDTS